MVEVAFYDWSGGISPDARLKARFNLLLGEPRKIQEQLQAIIDRTYTAATFGSVSSPNTS